MTIYIERTEKLAYRSLYSGDRFLFPPWFQGSRTPIAVTLVDRIVNPQDVQVFSIPSQNDLRIRVGLGILGSPPSSFLTLPTNADNVHSGYLNLNTDEVNTVIAEQGGNGVSVVLEMRRVDATLGEDAVLMEAGTLYGSLLAGPAMSQFAYFLRADVAQPFSDPEKLQLQDNMGMTVALAGKVSTDDYQFKRLITGYTGGGTTNLDGIPTAGKTFGLVEFIHATDGRRAYQLVAGAAATSIPGIIRPTDYDGSTNAVTWQSV